MVRLPTAVCVLTSLAACGSGPSVPRVAPQPPAPQIAAPVAIAPAAEIIPVDASAPAVAPARLACDPGTEARPAPAPEPTWYCARPDGTRDGPFVTAFPDGEPEITGAYRNGALDGVWQRHAVSGQIIESGLYAAGQKTGTWRMTGTSGAVLGTYDMRAGTGVEKHWLDDGTLYSERALKAGVANGAEKIYAADGTLIIVANWFAGKLDGAHAIGSRASLRIDETLARGVRRGNRSIWQFWSPLVDEAYDRFGKLDGDYTLWRDKNQPRAHGQYEHGKRDGLWTWMDRSNNKEREGNYVSGRRDGPWTEWFNNKIVFTGNYTQGKPDGDFIYYDHNENEIGRFAIANGTGTMLTYWPNKKIASRQHMYLGIADGIYQELTPKARVTVEGHYRGDAKQGAWKEWTADGVPTLDQSWKRGKLDGPVKKYADGVLVSEATYKDGKVTGSYTEYRRGKPSITGQFLDDKKTGTWTHYSTDGRVILTATYKDGVLDGSWKQLIDGVVLEGNVTQGRRTGTWTQTDKAGVVRQLTYQSLTP